MKQKQFGGKSHKNNILIQKRISLIFSIAGVVVIVNNIIFGSIRGFSFYQLLKDPSIWFTALLTFFFIIFIKINHWIIQLFHLVILLLASAITILEQYNNIYGTAFWIVSYLLAYRYNFLTRFILAKTILFMLFMIVFVEISAYHSPRSVTGFGILLFLSLFIILIYVIYKSEIDRIILSERKMEKSIQDLLIERNRLRNCIENDNKKLDKLEVEIELYHAECKPFDLKRCRLTPAEMRIVEILVHTRFSNKEISDQLGIKENTVKQHLYSVFNKMGVDDRFQIIDLCRHNFE